MTPELFEELGRIVGGTRRRVPFEQRERIIAAAALVDTYDELPLDIRELLDLMRAELPTETASEVTAAAEVHTGAMIALVPTEADAERLAVDGGEDADQLHVTLAYLGEAALIPEEVQYNLIECVARCTLDRPTIVGNAFALAAINPETGLTAAYDPSQLRDDHGRWTDELGVSTRPKVSLQKLKPGDHVFFDGREWVIGEEGFDGIELEDAETYEMREVPLDTDVEVEASRVAIDSRPSIGSPGGEFYDDARSTLEGDSEWVRNLEYRSHVSRPKIDAFVLTHGGTEAGIREIEELFRRHSVGAEAGQTEVDAELRQLLTADTEAGRTLRAYVALENAAHDLWQRANITEKTRLYRFGNRRDTESWSVNKRVSQFTGGESHVAEIADLRGDGYVLVRGAAQMAGSIGENEYFFIRPESNDLVAGAGGKEPCVALLLSGSQLPGFHEYVMHSVRQTFAAAGVEMHQQHSPWVAHLTLVYTPDADLSYFTDRIGPVTFDRVRVAFGGDVYDIPLGDTEVGDDRAK